MNIVSPDPTDLEALVTLLDLAAINLTKAPGDSFTKAELFREVFELWGPGAPVLERDLELVLKGCTWFRKARGRYQLR